MLGDISGKSLLRTLPMSFRPTLILNQPELPPKVIALFCNSNHRGIVVPGSNGKVVDISCSKAVFIKMNGSSQDWGDQVVRVTLPAPGPDLQCLDDVEREKTTNEFQSRFLMYRLNTVHRVRAAAADPRAFAGLELACNLLACVPDQPDVAATAVPLLQAQQQDFIAQQAWDLSSAIIEILWAKLHDFDSGKAVPVGRIADLANALLRNRGENRLYSAEEAGWRLRNLGIFSRKGRNSKFVQLSREVSQRVHQLVRERGIAVPLRVETCTDCAEGQIIAG